MTYTAGTVSHCPKVILIGLLAGISELSDRALAQVRASQNEIELRGICDTLIDRAVKRNYGWGWQAAVSGEGVAPVAGTAKASGGDKGKLPAEVMISFEPQQSPAAALVLIEAGVALNEERYLQAARMACRGFSAAADNAGRLPGEIPFGPTQIGRRTRGGLVVDQSPAAAAAAVMLTFERLRPDEHDKVFGTTARLLTTLSRLVTNTGGVATDEVNDRRVVRLDTSQLRDVALALALSVNVHGDSAHKQALQRIGDYLIRIRATDAGANLGRGVWVSAYDIEGQPVTDVESLPAQPNMAASANCAMTLLLSHLRNGDAQSFAALGLVADAAASFQLPNGSWPRLIAPSASQTAAPPVNGPFGAPEAGPTSGDWGWTPLLKAIGDLKLLGREDFLNLTKSVMPFERWAAWMACGLIDDPPPTDLPLSAREVDAFIAAHPAWFPKSSLAMTASTAELSQRATGFLLRLEWERKFSKVSSTLPATLPKGGK